jgi:arginine decarboxylase
MADRGSLEEAMAEAASLYVSLQQKGLPVRTVNFGGGMPMDTSAAAPTSHASMHEYIAVVVDAFKARCMQSGARQPRLVCESGGAVACTSSALLVTGYPTGALSMRDTWVRPPWLVQRGSLHASL